MVAGVGAASDVVVFALAVDVVAVDVEAVVSMFAATVVAGVDAASDVVAFALAVDVGVVAVGVEAAVLSDDVVALVVTIAGSSSVRARFRCSSSSSSFRVNVVNEVAASIPSASSAKHLRMRTFLVSTSGIVLARVLTTVMLTPVAVQSRPASFFSVLTLVSAASSRM